MAAVQVAVPAPLYRLFDYAVPDGLPAPRRGMRVRVPFGPRRLVGVVVGAAAGSHEASLKPIAEVLDTEPSLDEELMQLAEWAARYYQEPIGQVLATMLPGSLKRPGRRRVPPWLRLSVPAAEALARVSPRAHAQRALIRSLAQGPQPRRGAAAAALRRLEALGLVQRCEPPPPPHRLRDRPQVLTPDQAQALERLLARRDFGVDLLHGVTGSGKTEVYLQRIAPVVEAGGQVLVLVPEIALTPQLLQRFAARFGEAVASYHSGMADAERSIVRRRCAAGELAVVIGTRSSVFLPLPRLGLIVVDEEHDPSLKQQDGFRYHGRDLAIVRARNRNCPVLLGSATPSLETLHNAESGRYGMVRLPQRISTRPPPRIRLLDLRQRRLVEGLGEELLAACERHLADGNQVLLFINRRGFAPVLLCHACGWIAPCHQCDARMTVHRRQRLRCHHCGADRPRPARCPQCQDESLIDVGEGTQRIEKVLRARFPQHRIERVDSDRLRERGALEAILEDTRRGAIDILVGTQILAKGHDFGRLTLVGILNVDQALYGSDFRALERMGQLVSQVAGRAGRGEHAGEVLLQTHAPGHPMLQTLAAEGYDGLCRILLPERRQAGLPPFGYLALLRAESARADMPFAFLREAAQALSSEAVERLGPAPAPMERLAGRSRAQLLLRAGRRADLQRALAAWAPLLPQLPSARRVRWSLDVDPADLF